MRSQIDSATHRDSVFTRASAGHRRIRMAARVLSTGASGDITCQALDRVSMRANNAVVGAISIRRSSDKKLPIVFVQVPLGIAVPNAVRVGTTSGALQTIAILTRNRDGCFGNARLGEPLLNAMRVAKEPLHLAYDTFAAGATARTVTVNLGLDGFAAAYHKLR